MSGFIVPTDTIDRTISTIELQGGWARHAVHLPTSCFYDWNALGCAMLALNAEAYRQRYGDRVANDNADERARHAPGWLRQNDVPVWGRQERGGWKSDGRGAVARTCR